MEENYTVIQATWNRRESHDAANLSEVRGFGFPVFLRAAPAQPGSGDVWFVARCSGSPGSESRAIFISTGR